MSRYLYPLAAFILLGVSVRASAQTYYEQTFGPAESVRWHFAAGYSATVGQASQFFGDGFTLDGGSSWRPWSSLPLALRTDFSYSRFSATGGFAAGFPPVDEIAALHGYDEVFGLNFDGEYGVRLDRRIRGFALAGVGVAHMSSPVSESVRFVCSPSGAPCPAGSQSAFVIPLSSQTTRFSWNVGLGLQYALRDGLALFVEARYMRLRTLTPFEFVPITVGLSF